MYLPKTEIVFYFFVYISFLFYGIYQICMLSDEGNKWIFHFKRCRCIDVKRWYSFTHMCTSLMLFHTTVISSKSQYTGFAAGWRILNIKRDDLDFEWETWKHFVWKNIFWFLFHISTTEIIRWRCPKFISYAHVAVSMLFIFTNFNLSVVTIIVAKNFSFVLLMHLKLKIFIWLDATFWLFLIILFKYWEQHEEIEIFFDLNELQCYELLIILSWNVLKSISFSIDYITKEEERTTDRFDLINIFGYILYFPNLLLGPFMIFERYCAMTTNNVMWTTEEATDRLGGLVIDLSKAFFWFLFTDFALHFIYLGNLQHNAEVVQLLSPWCLYTFGYLMGQFFHNKYVVFYGLGTAIAKYENIKTPTLPKCIGRIHLYSDMWKYFDRGLYEFLFLYVYASICQKESSIQKKVFASFITFTFIYLWHGIYLFIFIWSTLNFICLQLEQIGRYIGRIQQHNLDKYLSQNNQNRLIALCGTQLFVPAVISNFYFFAGVDVGNVFVNRTYFTGSFVIYLSLSFCCYCIYHVSEVILRWETERKRIKLLKTI